MGLGWAWRLVSVAGIPVRVHWSFALLLVWAVALALAGSPAWPLDVASSLALMVAFFACVALHELGHGLVARRLGVAVRDIVLLPVGGMARFEVAAERRPLVDDLAITLAGPAVNAALALLLLAIDWSLGGTGRGGWQALPREWGHLNLVGFVTALGLGNLLLAVINLLPVVPLDGGRALRSILVRVAGEPDAARITAVVGLIVTAGFAIAGAWARLWWLAGGALVLAVAAGQHLIASRWKPDGGA